MTLLETLWNNEGDEAETVAALDSGDLQLSGNFRGHEAEVVADYNEGK